MTNPVPLPSAATGQPRYRTLTGVGFGMGAGALWGLVYITPVLIPAFGPLLLSLGRYLCYGLISLLILAPKWRALSHQLQRHHWLTLLWLAFSGNILFYVLLVTAIQTGGVAMTSLVIGFLPVAVTLVGSRDHDAVPLSKLLLSLACCVAGVICIGWQSLLSSPVGGDTSGTAPLIGLACAIGALTSWTLYAVGNARSLVRLKSISALDWNLLTGAVTGVQSLALIPLALLLENIHHSASSWWVFAAVSLGVAVFPSLIGNGMWHRMSRLLPLTLVGQMILFETLFALLYGLLWAQRLPTPLEFAALIFVIASVLTCLQAHHRRDKAVAAAHGLTREASAN